jgi:hypothetical protein
MSEDADADNLYFRIINKATVPLRQFAIAINANPVGLSISETPEFPKKLPPGETCVITVPVQYSEAAVANRDSLELQVALRTSVGNVFGLARIPVEFATSPEGDLEQEEFRLYYGQWVNSVAVKVSNATLMKDGDLDRRNIFVVGKIDERLAAAFQLPSGDIFVAEVAQQGNDIVALVKSKDPTLLPLVQQNFQYLFAERKQ